MISVHLTRSSGVEQITGLHVVEFDGTVNLGRYGMVRVAGMTITEARQAVERQMAQYFDSPRVSVDVYGFNSQGYYVVVAGAGQGENVQQFPITGGETVLDAISLLQGLSQISSKVMWVARPAPGGFGAEQVLPVDYVAIARGGVTDTNYQLLPGDRLYIVDDNIVAANHAMGKVCTPLEQLFNAAGMSQQTILYSQTLGRAYNQNRLGSF